MNAINKISHDEALLMIQSAVKAALEINKHIAVAVAGPEGELIAFVRMDGANPASGRIAQSKAYASARDSKPTRELGAYMLSEHREQGFWTDPGITGFGGGLPVFYEGKVIGAIGVSGLSEAEDERVADIAIRSVYE